MIILHKPIFARNFVQASSQYLSVATPAITVEPLTMACWFIANDASSEKTLMQVGRDTGEHRHYLTAGQSFGDTDLVAASQAGGARGSAVASLTYPIENWAHISGVWISASSRAVFLNGGNKGTNTSNLTISSMTHTHIGRMDSTDGRYHNGLIAWPCIWNVALTDVEIAKLASGAYPLSIKPTNIVAFWDWNGKEKELNSQFYRPGNLILTNNGSQPVSGPLFLKTPLSYFFFGKSSGVTTYTATVAVTHSGAISSSVAAFDPPVFSGTIVVAHSGATSVSTVTFTAPTFSATATVEADNISCIVVTTFDPPVYSATVGISNSGATCALVGTFTKPVYTGIVEVGYLSRTIQNLLCFSGTPSQADLIQFVADFNAIIDDSSTLSNVDFRFLDQGTLDGEITYADRDYWIDRITDKYLSPTGRTFGSAAPSTIDEADPLGLLKDSAGNPRLDTVILDPQGANENTTQTDAPVKITVASSSPCTTPNGAAKSPASLWTTTGSVWRYRFWTRIFDFDESAGSGSGRVRFLDAGAGIADKVVTVYVRYSDQHILEDEIRLGKRPDGTGSHAKRIIIRGYPSDKIPFIPCGNSITGVGNDVTTETEMIGVGPNGVGQSRQNMIFERLHWSGKRLGTFGTGSSEVSGYIFASEIFHFYGGSINNEFIRCNLTDSQPIPADHPDAGTFPEYIDISHDGRADPRYASLYITADNFTLTQCLVEVSGDDLPLPFPSDTGFLGFTMTFEGADVEITDNLIRGRSLRSPLRFLGATRPYIARNFIHTDNYKAIFCTEDTDANRKTTYALIELNFIEHIGTISGQSAEGIDFGEGSYGNTVRYNVLFSEEPITGETKGLSCTGAGGVTSESAELSAYSNIVYNLGIVLGYDGGWDDLDPPRNLFRSIRFQRNLVHSFPSANSAVTAAPIRVKLNGTIQNDLGNLFDENNVTRNSGTTALLVRTTHETADPYTVDSILDGWTNNTAIDPQFTDPGNGDFSLPSDSPFLSWFPVAMPYRQADMLTILDYNPLDDLCSADIGIIGESTSTFDPPVYTGSVVLIHSGAISTSTAVFASAVFSGQIVVANSGATCIVVATFTAPVYTGTLAVEADNIICDIDGTTTKPTYTGTISPIVDNIICNVVTNFDAPVFSSTIVVANSGAISASQSSFALLGVSTATCEVDIPQFSCSAIVTFEPGIFDNTIYSALFNSFDISI